MDVAIIVALVALGGTIVNGWISYRSSEPSALKDLVETIAKLSTTLDLERDRRIALQKQFAITVVELETRIYELEERVRATHRQLSHARKQVTRLEEQLLREGLKPDTNNLQQSGA